MYIQKHYIVMVFQWQWGSTLADTNGVATFDDTNAPLYPHRFYKGVTP